MRKLEDMNLEELWKLFPIRLVSHDIHWKTIANDEIQRLSKILESFEPTISHIGSTAIDGIMAKPIIDFLVEIKSEVSFEKVKDDIIGAGYLLMNNNGDRMSFNRGYTPEGYAERVYHLHLRHQGDNDEVYFCDYLNKHPEVAKLYENLKIELCRKYEYDRDAYTASKSEFVRHYTSLAKQHFITKD